MSEAKRVRVDIDLCDDSDSADVMCSTCCTGCALQHRCKFCADVFCAECAASKCAVIVAGLLHCRWCVQHLAAEFAAAERRFSENE